MSCGRPSQYLLRLLAVAGACDCRLLTASSGGNAVHPRRDAGSGCAAVRVALWLCSLAADETQRAAITRPTDSFTIVVARDYIMALFTGLQTTVSLIVTTTDHSSSAGTRVLMV
jgi:hypothetical protein